MELRLPFRKAIMPEASYDLIREKVKKAMGRIGTFKPYKVSTPIQLECGLKTTGRPRS